MYKCVTWKLRTISVILLREKSQIHADLAAVQTSPSVFAGCTLKPTPEIHEVEICELLANRV